MNVTRVFSGLFIVCFWIIAVSCNQSSADRMKARPPEIPVMKLKTKPVTLSRNYICEIKAVQYVEIRARVQGYLEDIYVDEGDQVKKGQPLFRISSNEYKEHVTRSEANLQQRIAEAKMKKLNVERIKLMVDKNVISKSELEVASAQLEAAESGVREAQSVLDNAKINLNYTYIRAPFNGLVDLIPFKIGSLINSGTLLTSVSKIDEVFAYFKVSEAEYIRLSGGELRNNRFSKEQRKIALLLADGSKYKHPGYIETMEGEFDRETGSIAIRARFQNPEKLLKHGSSGKILMRKKLDSAMLVPQESAFSIQDKNYVYVVDKKNIVRATNFTTVEQTEKDFVIEGLKEGDRIVLEGVTQLRDGMEVVPKNVSSDTSRISKL